LSFFENYHSPADSYLGITFLIGPVDRSISEFFHYRKSDQTLEFEHFLKMETWRNKMCKEICGVGGFEKSKRVLSSIFSCVLIAEYFDQSLVYLKDLLEENGFATDFIINYSKLNVNSNIDNQYRKDLQEKYHTELCHLNSEDIKLYNYYRKHFEDKMQNDELRKKTVLFRKKNQKYLFNKGLIMAMKAFRKIYIENIELICRARQGQDHCDIRVSS